MNMESNIKIEIKDEPSDGLSCSKISDVLRKKFEILRNKTTIQERIKKTPKYIKNCELREYQIHGVNWMINLYENKINGILADEMGLGKTLQTITFLAYLKHELKIKNQTYLIMVPLNTLNNWKNELERFCPTLKTFMFYGNKEEKKVLRKKFINDDIHYDILLTTYDVVIYESSFLKKYSWYYLILDEAHRIKKDKSVLKQILSNEFTSSYRLMLTGTPIQNNTKEFWSLLNFLMPELFKNHEDFEKIFNEENLNSNKEILEYLRSITHELLLRRLKVEVEKHLPTKHEFIIYAGLTDLQRDIYKSLLLNDIKLLDQLCANAENKFSFFKLLGLVVQLRKCCCHPYLFPGIENIPESEDVTNETIVSTSGKMVILDKLLNELYAKKHRCLIFSQFKMVLDVLEDYVQWKKFKYCRFDGTTGFDERKNIIDEFQNGTNYFIFLITTRAGGIGINLTAADTVIIYDSDWNPFVDKQAIDRAHRIGQDKPVNVYRLVTENTVEERIIDVANRKLNLNNLVIDDDFSLTGGDNLDFKYNIEKTKLLDVLTVGLDKILTSNDTTRNNQIDIKAMIEFSKEKLKTKITQQSTEQSTYKVEAYTNAEVAILKENMQRNVNLLRANKNYTVYNFEGENYEIKKRQAGEGSLGRKRYDIENIDQSRTKRPKNDLVVEKHHFYPKRLQELLDLEAYAHKKHINYRPILDPSNQSTSIYTEEISKIQNARDLTPNEYAEKEQLMKSNEFQHWSHDDLRIYLKSCKLYGRFDYERIQEKLENKSIDDIKAYSKVFWLRYTDLSQSEQQTCERILKAEKQQVGDLSLPS